MSADTLYYYTCTHMIYFLFSVDWIKGLRTCITVLKKSDFPKKLHKKIMKGLNI